MPWDFAVRANHAIQRHCGDGFEVFHVGVQALACSVFISFRFAGAS
jgi:hypothetical protein